MGLFLKQGLSEVRRLVPSLLEDGENELTFEMRSMLSKCHEKLLALDEEVDEYTQKIERFCKYNPKCTQLMTLSGVGPMIASILFATIGDHPVSHRMFA